VREIVIDTETTGLNHKGGDRVIEVACVELINHISTGNNLQFYCSTEKKIDAGAMKVHGITNAFLEKHPSFESQSDVFLEFIKEDVLIIHNSDFDMGFLNNELRLIKKPPLKNDVIDTVQLARKTLNTRIANLNYLCNRFSIDLSSRKLHGALLDCQLLAMVYLELIGGQQTKLELSNPSTKEETFNKKNIEKITSINKINLSEKEVAEHKIFVKGLKNALWHKIDY
jgi:DNA polymerase-3 subunit epsilon